MTDTLRAALIRHRDLIGVLLDDVEGTEEYKLPNSLPFQKRLNRITMAGTHLANAKDALAAAVLTLDRKKGP